MTTATPHAPENAEEKVTTVIADDLHIKGTITFNTSLMIKGTLEGEILSQGLLVVGPTARINATIVTKSLVSYGDIHGDVTATEKVVLKGAAIHTGNITTPYIVVENGSLFNGSCVMKRDATAAAALHDAAVAAESAAIETAQQEVDEAEPEIEEEASAAFAEQPASEQETTDMTDYVRPEPEEMAATADPYKPDQESDTREEGTGGKAKDESDADLTPRFSWSKKELF